jgi:hypothetical protein
LIIIIRSKKYLSLEKKLEGGKRDTGRERREGREQERREYLYHSQYDC